MLLLLALPLYDGGQIAHNQRVADIDEWSHSPVSLVHDIAILEVVHERNGALDTCVSEWADLLTVEHLPTLPIELLVEVRNKLGVEEVNERIAHITRILRIGRDGTV